MDALKFPHQLSMQSIAESLRGTLLTAVLEVLEGPNENVAMFHVPISGTVDRPQSDYWTGVRSLLENAFFDARKSGFQRDSATH